MIDIPVSMPLRYDDTASVSNVERILFVHSAASALQAYANSTTFAVVYNDSSILDDIFVLIRRKFSSQTVLPRIGFAFHNNGERSWFLNREAWFSDSDLEESQPVFSENTQFMLDFIGEFHVTNIDFLACNTLDNAKWRRYFELLHAQTNVVVGGSDDETGNMKYGGDWIMESTMEDVRDIYFTTAIGNYTSLLMAPVTFPVSTTFSSRSATVTLESHPVDAVSWKYSSDSGSTWTIQDLSMNSFVLEENTYAVDAIRINWLGIVSADVTNSSIIVIDFTGPFGLAVTFPPATFATNQSIVSITTLPTDAVSWQYSVDSGSTWTTKDPATSSSFLLPDGTYIVGAVQVRCTDAAGNNSTSIDSTDTFIIDQTAPSGLTVVFPSSTSLVSTSDIVYVSAIPADAVSWEYSLDSGSTWTTDISSSGPKTITLAEGTYVINSIRVKCSDAVGNYSTPITNTNEIVIDHTPPTGLTVTFPQSTTPAYKVATIFVTFFPPDATDWQYSLDSGSTWSSSIPVSINTFVLPDGTYAVGAVKVRCNDHAGNYGELVTNSEQEIIMNIDGPAGMTVFFPATTTSSNKGNAITITNMPYNAASWEYSVDSGSTWTAKDLSSNSVTLPDGTYEIDAVQVRCADAVGNVSVVVLKNSAQIILDLVAPVGMVVTFPSTTSKYNQGLLCNVSVIPSDSVSWQYSVDSGSTWVTKNNWLSRSFTVPNGLYVVGAIQVRCADVAGNNSAIKSNLKLIFVNNLAINYTGLTDANIQAAVNLWISNPTSCTTTYGHIRYWDTSRVTLMEYLFSGKTTFNSDISMWDVSSVTSMNGLFKNASAFNGDISEWNTSSLVQISETFRNASSFNCAIGAWNVSHVTNMIYTFSGAIVFNQNIGAWDVSSVIYMHYMFAGAIAFNQYIGAWNVGNLIVTVYMFSGATAFNQNIGAWNVSKITDMSYMFADATSFNQEIGSWNVTGTTGMAYMFYNAAIFNGNISTWTPTAVTNTVYMFAGASAFNQNISSWVMPALTDFSFMFNNAISFNQPVGVWDITNVIHYDDPFLGATAFNQNVSSWYIITDINVRAAVNLWCENPAKCTSMYGHMSDWDTVRVTDMSYLFAQKYPFNTDISRWNTSNVTNMYLMFMYTDSFNQPIGSWDTSKVVIMYGMFLSGSGGGYFNHPIGDWNVSNVVLMQNMFQSQGYFNQDLSKWDVRKVVSMDGMFAGTTSFNQDLTKWEVPLIPSFPYQFRNNSWVMSGLEDKNLPHWGTYRLNLVGPRESTVYQNRIYIDEGVSNTYSTITSTGQVNISIPGAYVVEYFATAAVTGLSAPSYTMKTVTVIADPDPPMMVTFPPSTSLTIKDNNFYLTYLRADMVSWTYSLDSGSTWLTTDLSSALIPEGTHPTNKIRLKSLDGSGNSMVYSNPDYIIIDFTGPLGIAVTYPLSTSAANFPGNVGSITFMPADAASWQYSLDAGVTWFTRDLSSTTFTLPQASYPANGVYVRCTDAVGNNSGVVMNSAQIIVDLDGPVGLTANFPVSSTALLKHTLVSVTYMPYEAVSWQYSLDTGTTWTTQDLSSSSFDISQGVYKINDIQIRGTNLAGVNSAVVLSNTTLIAIDFTGPYGLEVLFPRTSSPTIRETVMTVTALPPSAVSWEHTIDSGVTWTSHTTTSSSSITLAQAIYAMDQIQVRCTDIEGNVCVPVTNVAELTIDLISPSGLEVIFPYTTSPAHTGMTVSVSVLPIDAVSWNYSVDSGTTWVVKDRTHTSFVLANGVYAKNAVRVNCQDKVGNLSGTITNSALIAVNHLAANYTPISDATIVAAVGLWISDPTTCSAIYGDIRYWDTTAVTNMSSLFTGTFNADISQWNVANVTNMSSMFANATLFNADIRAWNVANVTNTSLMFKNAAAFNQPIGGWNVGNVVNMGQMFSGAVAFNQPLSSWDVAKVTDMNNLFNGATVFNNHLNSWVVSSVVNFSHMFHGAAAFNRPLESWNLVSATDTSYMFDGAVVFNADIGGWNMSNVTNTSYMFAWATVFNQNIGAWSMTNVTDMSYMFNNAIAFNGDISTWVPSKIYNMNYMFAGASAFNQNISGWNVGTVVYVNFIFYNAIAFNQPVGVWNVTGVAGMMSAFIGTTALTYDVSAWRRMTNTNIRPAVNLWISDPTSCINTYGHISFWDTSLVTNMDSLFQAKTTFNTDISGWNVSNVTSMNCTFYFAGAFNQPIGGWNVMKVTDMAGMFASASAFNKPLNGWNTDSLTRTVAMFRYATVFNQPLNNWNMSKVWNTTAMFQGGIFNQPIDNWNVSNVIVMNTMFESCVFKQPIGSWDVKKVNDMYSMFGGSTVYDEDLSMWETPLGGPSQFSYHLPVKYTPNWGCYALHTVGPHILTITQHSVYVDAGVSDTYSTITKTGTVNTAVLGTYQITYNVTAIVTNKTPSAPAKVIRWVTVAVDANAPFVAAFPASSSLTNKGNTVNVTNFQPSVVSWQSSIDSGVTWTTRAKTTTSFVLSDGTYAYQALRIKSTDSSGNTSTIIANSAQIVLDTIGPLGLAVTFPASTTVSNRGRSITVNTLPSDAVSWQFSVDTGSTWTTVSSSVLTASLSENTYAIDAIQVRCADAVGNNSAVLKNTVQIIIDLTAPIGLAITIPASPSNQGINIASLPADAVSWKYTTDGGINWTSQTRSSSSFVLAEGTYATNSIQVTCQDDAGNVATPIKNTSVLVIDFTPPTGLAVTFPVSTTASNRGNTVQITVLPSDAVSWQYSVNGGITWFVGSATSFLLAEKTYDPNSIKVRCKDLAGNTSVIVANSMQIIIDFTAPTGFTATFPSSTTPTNGFAAVTVANIPNDAVTWRYSANSGSTWTTIDVSFSSFTLGTGSYLSNTVLVSCTDAAGNDSVAIPNSSRINIGPSGMAVTFPLSTSPASLIAAVQITTLPTDAATWAYTINGGSSWIIQAKTVSSFILPNGTYIPHDVQVRCGDALGNLSVSILNPVRIVIEFYNGYVPPIIIPAGADPAAPITVSRISSLSLTDTAVIGNTPVAQQLFTTNVMRSLFTANTAQSQLVLPAGSILPGYITPPEEPIYLFNASSALVNGAKSFLTHANIMGKSFYVLLEAGDTIRMQTNVDIVTISKTGSIFTITSKISTTTAVVGDTYDYDGLHIILGSVVGNLVATTVNFVLTALNSQFQTATSALIPEYNPIVFTSDATITLSNAVPASVIQRAFFFRTDDPITTDASFVYYYVDVTKWPTLNTDLSPRNGVVTSNGYVSNDPVGKDFIRDLARQLFGTYLGADLFTNEDGVVGDINSRCDQVSDTILTLLTSIDKISGTFNGIDTDSSGNKYMKDDQSTSNISRELFNQLITVAPGRFENIKTNYNYNSTEDGFYSMPIIPGDTFTFKLSIFPASGQVSSVPTGPEILSPRTYTVIMTVS